MLRKIIILIIGLIIVGCVGDSPEQDQTEQTQKRDAQVITDLYKVILSKKYGTELSLVDTFKKITINNSPKTYVIENNDLLNNARISGIKKGDFLLVYKALKIFQNIPDKQGSLVLDSYTECISNDYCYPQYGI